MLLTIVIFIITILFLMFIHELGHFLMAKKFGIKVLEFGFGIPPRIFGKKIGETILSINWLPIGAFVRLLGEDEEPLAAKTWVLDKNRDFRSKGVGARIIVVVAGVVMNFLLAFLLFYIVLGFQGFKAKLPLLLDHQFVGVTQKNEVYVLVSEVAKGSPAEKAGINPGERIVAINDRLIAESSELSEVAKSEGGKEVKLSLSSPDKDENREVTIVPRKDPPAGEGPLGVALSQIRAANLSYETPLQKAFAGPLHAYNIVIYSGKITGNLINKSFSQKSFGPVSTSVAGPVGITSIADQILKTNNPALPYLDFVALISLNLAVFNLLPIPALDGGRLFFLLIEAITRKRVHAQIERWVHTIGMVLLLTLTLLVTLSDLKKIF